VKQNTQFCFTPENFYMKRVNKFLTVAALTAATASVLLVAHATSVREFEKMPRDEQVLFLAKETDGLLAKVGKYDPALEQKTRAYMFDETNQWGYVKGGGAVLATIDRAEKTRPETLDRLQVETITKVVMRAYWKDQGIVVPKTIFDETNAPTPVKPASAGP
jgi:hypothetical protein